MGPIKRFRAQAPGRGKRTALFIPSSPAQTKHERSRDYVRSDLDRPCPSTLGKRYPYKVYLGTLGTRGTCCIRPESKPVETALEGPTSRNPLSLPRQMPRLTGPTHLTMYGAGARVREQAQEKEQEQNIGNCQRWKEPPATTSKAEGATNG